ncbi:THO complex subunit 7 [Orchesella cincta]|uniref:THO complex subunit 7 n=1 Tax=Orchesella cincta TaxID=48709 RepID=A0A1D2NES6_ORCCI|nr:THO complex subunit 7 [Orchesella cincta]
MCQHARGRRPFLLINPIETKKVIHTQKPHKETVAPRRFPVGVMAGKAPVNVPERWIGKEDSVAVNGPFKLKTPPVVPNSEEQPVAAGSSSAANETEPEAEKMDSLFLASEDAIVRRRLLIDGDGQGDDKRLTKVIQLYVLMDEESMQPEDRVEHFREMLTNTDSLRTYLHKTVHLIEVNKKAKYYWGEVMNRIGEELNSHRGLVAAQREKLAELKLTKQQNVEATNAVKLLEGTMEREALKQKCKELEAQCEALKERDAELAAVIAYRKHHLTQLCDLAKRLTDELPEVVEQAIKETEDRVLSDVSLDLE